MKQKYISKAIIEDLNKLINMHWHQEKIHWEESCNPEDHIFHSWNNIKNWLKGKRIKYPRICCVCNNGMNEGYLIGWETYCSDKCRQTIMSDKEWEAHYVGVVSNSYLLR